MKTPLFATVIVSTFACITAQLQGSVSPNIGGGNDLNIVAAKRFGDENGSIGGGIFAAGNLLNGPGTAGGFLDASKNGHSVGLQQSITPGVGSSFSQSAHLNLLKKDVHKLNANAFHSRTNTANGFNYDNFGAGLNYNHDAGHSASLSASRIPQLDRNSIGLTGKANLWSSPNRRTSLDLTGTASRSFGGHQPPSNNFGAGLGLTHFFG